MLATISRDGAETLTLAEQAFLFMVFALGALERNDPKCDMFYKHAEAVAFKVFAEICTESCLFAFLFCFYQQVTGQIEAAWTTLGIAVRIAQALGC
jgi:Fungal specific transcription factor domain